MESPSSTADIQPASAFVCVSGFPDSQACWHHCLHGCCWGSSNASPTLDTNPNISWCRRNLNNTSINHDLDTVLTLNPATANDRDAFYSALLSVMRARIEGAGIPYDQSPVDLADFRRMTALLFSKEYMARQAESFEWMERELSFDACEYMGTEQTNETWLEDAVNVILNSIDRGEKEVVKDMEDMAKQRGTRHRHRKFWPSIELKRKTIRSKMLRKRI